MARVFWIDSYLPNADDLFAQNLRYMIKIVNASKKPIAFACIGSAAVCGDNLGPIIGSILKADGYFPVFGCMQAPIHALTLPNDYPVLYQLQEKYCLIAIDASLGHTYQAGAVTIADTCLYPGSACGKNFPGIGAMHITGVFHDFSSPAAKHLLPVLCRTISLGILNQKTATQRC